MKYNPLFPEKSGNPDTTRSGEEIHRIWPRRIIHDQPVPYRDALTNPEPLDLHRDREELPSGEAVLLHGVAIY